MESNDKDDLKLFSKQIDEKEKRKLKALNEHKESVWSGLGMFGMIGWSVVVPSLLGAASGIWLDKNYPQSFSWTLTCLILGLVLGCIIAWNWVANENEKIHQEKKD